jgi:adenine phosphoribosyltransferase
MMMSKESINAAIRDIPDFPKPGILFKDITPVLKNHALLTETIDLLASRWIKNPPDYVAGIESRGFIFGSALALKLGCGFIPVRKKGKLPFKTIEASYKLEYGEATIEVHSDAVNKGDRVLIIDDLLATGGTVLATASLFEQLKADVVGMEFVIELAFLNARNILSKYNVNSIITIN